MSLVPFNRLHILHHTLSCAFFSRYLLRPSPFIIVQGLSWSKTFFRKYVFLVYLPRLPEMNGAVHGMCKMLHGGEAYFKGALSFSG